MRPRLGAVSFLNTRPLVYTLERDAVHFDLSYSVPSRCASALASGAVDVGLIPTIEYARSAEPYYIAPGVAIGTRGAVLTVRLYYRGDVQRIEKVALDLSSRTSVALLRILLREKFALDPVFVDAEPNLEVMLATADAALVIGDPVFALLGQECESLDLGAEWFDMTGLPFVFAFWTGRAGALNAKQAQMLLAAKVEGIGHISEIAKTYSREHGGDPAFYKRYLQGHIDFDLDDRALQGLSLFYDKASEHGLIPAVPELRFYAAEGGA